MLPQNRSFCFIAIPENNAKNSVKAACRMMDENPNFRISELAYKVGFNDPKYFSICFKKIGRAHV